jgi:hypothetical protein
MRIDEILTEDENFNFNLMLQQHRDGLQDSGADADKIRYIISYIKNGTSQIKSASDFNTWANSAQDAYDAEKQKRRDTSQDKEIRQRPSDTRSDGTEKTGSNQYVSRGNYKSKGMPKGIVPDSVKRGTSQGANLAKALTAFENTTKTSQRDK